MSFNSSTYMVKQHNKRLLWGALKTYHVYWSDLDMFGKRPPRYAYICLLFAFWNSLDRILSCFIRWPIASMVQQLKFCLICNSIGSHSCFSKYSQPPSRSILYYQLGARTESPADKIPRGQNPRDFYWQVDKIPAILIY